LVVPKISQSDIFCNHVLSKHQLDLFDYCDRCYDIPRYLSLDDLFLKVLGVYIAEGYTDIASNQVCFRFHINETHFQNLIRSYFHEFNLCITEHFDENSIGIHITSAVFANLFSKLCGFNSLDKKLPTVAHHNTFMGSWSKQQIYAFLWTYFEGDGYNDSYNISSVSHRLISEIQLCLLSCGCLVFPQKLDNISSPSCSTNYGSLSKWNDTYLLKVNSNYRDNLVKEFDTEVNNDTLKQKTPCTCFIDDLRYYYVKIKSVTPISYQGSVYNISVEDDHSYTVNGFAIRNCHYIEPEDAEFQKILMCMSTGRSIKDPKRIKFPYDEFYFKSAAEMYQFFNHTPSYMRNTLEVAEKCDYSDIVFGEMRLPNLDLPEGETPFSYLTKLAYEGLTKRGWNKSQRHIDRLERELSDIKLILDTKNYDFSTYFLIEEDMVRFAERKNIPYGVRGSGYGSLLLHCLGLCKGIDPLSRDLLWERFLGFDFLYFICENDFGISDSCQSNIDSKLEQLSNQKSISEHM